MIDAPILERIATEAAALLPDDAVLCLGIGCHLHQHCARWLAMDGAMGVHEVIDTCGTGRFWPLYVLAPQPCPHPREPG